MKILIRKDGKFFKEVDFEQDELILGRSKETDVQLFNEDVSRKHTKISRKQNRFFIEDLGSKNGTVFRGKLTQKSEVKPGDIFYVGPFSISIEDVLPSEQRTIVEFMIAPERKKTKIQEPVEDSEPAVEVFDPSEDTDLRPVSDSFFEAVEEIVTPSISVNPDEAFEEESNVTPGDDPKTFHSVMAPIPTKPKSPAKKIAVTEKDFKTEVMEPVIEKNPTNDDDDFFNAISVDREPSISAKPPISLNFEDKADEESFKSESLTEIENIKTIPYKETSLVKKLGRVTQKLEDDRSQPIVQPDPKPESDPFPPASENLNEGAEQFFLNRELDEGVAESFDDFPETNKTKPMAELDFSLSEQVEGQVEDEELPEPSEPSIKAKKPYNDQKTQAESELDSDSDAILTGSFENAKTDIVTPEEDQIKTFMFNPNELAPTNFSEKTDEFSTRPEKKPSGFVKKILAIIPASISKIKNPTNKRFVFVIGAVVLGLGVFFLSEGTDLFHHQPVNPETAINNEDTFQKLGRGERKRVILFQIDQIKKLVASKDMQGADARMTKLMTLASNDDAVIKFEKDYQQQREAILEQENQKQKQLDEKKKSKDKMLAEGQKLLDSKQFDLAKKSFTRILEIFPDDQDAQEKIQTVELLQEQEERKAFAKKQRYAILDKIYNEGVQKYESGQPGVAQKLFAQVATEKAHPKAKSASDYLNKIENLTDKKVDQQIAKAKDMIQKPATLIQGYTDLKKLSSQFPLRTDAKKYLADAKDRMDKKARELYADALAQEELAGDPAAALDLYKEVLKYAPDPSNKYYQKAKAKIDNLQL